MDESDVVDHDTDVGNPVGVAACGKEYEVAGFDGALFDMFAELCLFGRIAGEFDSRGVEIDAQYHSAAIGTDTFFVAGVWIGGSEPVVTFAKDATTGI